MEYVTRLHLKTCGASRQELINFCLHGPEQYLAIGWSYVYKNKKEIHDFRDFYDAVKLSSNRMPHVLNTLWYTKEGDLFWTRDLQGFYWICQAKGPARPANVNGVIYPRPFPEMDIGAVIPVKAYKVGQEVPGQIKASFNRPRGGTCEDLRDPSVIEYSKYRFNCLTGSSYYEIGRVENCILDNLPDFELEELVIAYLQIKERYYVLSNSIANRSTTVKIECAFIRRDKSSLQKAVVQVKGGHSKEIDAREYLPYNQNGYRVYLYAPTVKNAECLSDCIVITKDDLLSFYQEYKVILPNEITIWENLISEKC